MRQLGAGFDPERVCEYTGLALHQFPVDHAERALMGYWRTDGFLCAVRPMTGGELLWIAENAARFEADRQAFKSWLDRMRPNCQS